MSYLLAALIALATIGLEHSVLWLVRFIWPPVIVVPEGAELDLDALTNGQRVLIIPGTRKRWRFLGEV